MEFNLTGCKECSIQLKQKPCRNILYSIIIIIINYYIWLHLLATVCVTVLRPLFCSRNSPVGFWVRPPPPAVRVKCKYLSRWNTEGFCSSSSFASFSPIVQCWINAFENEMWLQLCCVQCLLSPCLTDVRIMQQNFNTIKLYLLNQTW